MPAMCEPGPYKLGQVEVELLPTAALCCVEVIALPAPLFA